MVMSHLFESGLFVRQAAWHGLGTVVQHDPDPLEAYVKSELNWDVDVCPLRADLPLEVWIATPYFAVVRQSDKAILGSTKGYWTPWQNRQAFEWCVPLVESGHWKFETCGSLAGGERCWILLNQGEREVVNGDVLKNFLLVMWAHDGKTANVVQPTSIRVVCNNTLSIALRAGAKDTSRRTVRHSQFVNMNMKAIRELYETTDEDFTTQAETFRTLAVQKLTKKRRGEVLDELFGKITNMSTTRARSSRQLVEDVIEQGSGLEEQKLIGTAYGTLMGISEAVEHFVGGEKVKDRGLNVLVKGRAQGRGARDVLDKAFKLIAA